MIPRDRNQREGNQMTTTISMTQQHIDEGTQHHCSLCPTARAIKDAYAKQGITASMIDVAVGYCGMVEITRLRDGKQAYHILPEEAEQWIKDYDNGRPVHPITFDMDLLTLEEIAA